MTEQNYNDTDTCCEYQDCERTGVTFDESLQAWLCEEHEDTPSNSTGYCNRECQLGYGCDESC